MKTSETVRGEVGGLGTDRVEPHAVVVHGEPDASVPALAQDNSIPALMRLALQQAGPEAVAALERLVNLQVGIEERAAKKECAAAMARFKAKLALSPIIKDKSQQQGADVGTSFAITWASAAAIASVIDPLLAEVGLSYKWSYKLDANMLHTTCRAQHENGHFEETTVVMPTESRAGMSPQQKISSAQAFGDRLSLIGVFGLTTAEAEAPRHSYVDPTPISSEQVADLLKMIGSHGLSLQKFLVAMNLASVVEIPAARLAEATLMIQQAIEARQARAAKESELPKAKP